MFTKSIKYNLLGAPVRLLDKLGMLSVPKRPIAFVCEKTDWAIRWEGTYICQGIEKYSPGKIFLCDQPYLLARQLVHFGSQFDWLNWHKYLPTSNKYVVNFFHGKPEDSAEMSRHINDFIQSAEKISKIVTASSTTYERLMKWGIPRKKIHQIPISVDLQLFRPAPPSLRREMRELYGISDDCLCIGSFQKDGVGWAEGNEPKLIKGPDLFVDAVNKVMKARKVFVLLTGPSRGYVKRRLADIGVPFYHEYVKEYTNLPKCYAALDVYVNPSREEGGPKGLLEAMACNIPVVSTRVGMAPDIIKNGISGDLVEVGDVDGLAQSIVETLKIEELNRQVLKARDAVLHCDFNVVAIQYYEDVYKQISATL